MKNLNLTMAENLLLPPKAKKDRKDYFNEYNNRPEIKKSEIAKLNNKIKDLELDLRIKILDINILNKQKRVRDYGFYLKISNLLEQAQKILSICLDEYYGKNEKTWSEKGLLGLLREKNVLSEPDHSKSSEKYGELRWISKNF